MIDRMNEWGGVKEGKGRKGKSYQSASAIKVYNRKLRLLKDGWMHRCKRERERGRV